MKWIDNVTNILRLHNAGKCPHCGSENTDYRLIEISNGNGCGDVWCNDCKKAFHISRVKVSKEIIKDNKLPSSLNY